MADPVLRQEILQTLEKLHAAQAAEDVDAMADTFSETGFKPRKRMRPYFASQVEGGVYRSQRADHSGCEVFVHGNTALVRPVTYTTPMGERYFSFHLRNEQEGRWFIIDSSSSAPLGSAFFTPELLANAARLVGERSMLWVRRIEVPVERVWPIISTKEGLDQWWLGRVEIDLKPGGLFKHHWNNKVRDFREMEFINFGPSDEEGAPNHLMRFAIAPDGDATIFSFLDTFEGSDSPLTLPWIASGWHGTVDALEHALTGRKIETDFGLGGEFYWRYLRECHAIASMVSVRTMPAVQPAWREAYLADPL